MNAQEIRQIPQLRTEELLEKRKTAILNLIEQMSENLPPVVKIMVNQYHSMVCQFVDKLTLEQTDELIEKVEGILDDLRG